MSIREPQGFHGWVVPWDWLGGGQHWDKLGAVGNLLLDFRTGNDVGSHLHQSHLRTDTQPRTGQPDRVLTCLLSHTSGVDRWGRAAPIRWQQGWSTSNSYLLAAAPAGGFEWGELLLHPGRALDLLGVKGHSAKRAEGGGHLKTRLKTLPTEPGWRQQQSEVYRLLQEVTTNTHTCAAFSAVIHLNSFDHYYF